MPIVAPCCYLSPDLWSRPSLCLCLIPPAVQQEIQNSCHALRVYRLRHRPWVRPVHGLRLLLSCHVLPLCCVWRWNDFRFHFYVSTFNFFGAKCDRNKHLKIFVFTALILIFMNTLHMIHDELHSDFFFILTEDFVFFPSKLNISN